MAKVYVGFRTEQGCKVQVWDGSRFYPLPPRLDVRNHSPAGFEWGYGGSGPAQLALALVINQTGDEDVALRVYQEVKRRLVGYLPRDCWRMDELVLLDVIAVCFDEERERLQKLAREEACEGKGGD